MVPTIREMGDSAKLAAETMRTDARIIEIWPRFVGASDRISATNAILPEGSIKKQYALGERGIQLIRDGASLIIIHANTRIPMPISTREFLQRCDRFVEKYGPHLSAG